MPGSVLLLARRALIKLLLKLALGHTVSVFVVRSSLQSYSASAAMLRLVCAKCAGRSASVVAALLVADCSLVSIIQMVGNSALCVFCERTG